MCSVIAISTEAGLRAAIIENYRASVLDRLGEPLGLTVAQAMERILNAYREATQAGNMCLCTALGATAGHLPDDVRAAVTQFAQSLISALHACDDPDNLHMLPESIVALLQGASLISSFEQESALFETAFGPLA